MFASEVAMFDKFLDWYTANEKNPFKAYAAFILLIALCSIGWWVTKSRMEASAFNRITNSDVTTWDAMWVQLRVDRPTSD